MKEYNQKETIDIFMNYGIYVDIENLDDEFMLDSLVFTQLLINLEEYYGIIIPSDEINMENFKSFMSVENLLCSLLSNYDI